MKQLLRTLAFVAGALFSVTGFAQEKINLSIGLAMADVSQDALQGEGKFKGSKVPLTTLMVLYTNHMHVVTVEGTGITSVKDLKGKRVSTGSPGSATEGMAVRILEAA